MRKMVEPKIIAIIQARTGSTRLPGKVMMDISGKPMLSRVVERTKRAQSLEDVVVATTIETSDEPIVKLCEANEWPYFRGSEDDVLDRYYRAARVHRGDVVVRITSDCPLIDPTLIDEVVQVFLDRQQDLDYVSNNLQLRSFPRGLDIEVIRFSCLKKAWEEDRNPAWREHVTQYVRHHPELFRLHRVVNDQDYSSMRWTVDTPEDLEFVRTIYAHFGHDLFSWHDILMALEQHPEWLAINRYVRQKAEPS
jgi:spore coat polysaccharide biosynthesis protein SpsF